MFMKVVKFTVLSALLIFVTLSAQVGEVMAVTKVAKTTPWSGWWWPYTEGGLSTGRGYRGKPAPLEKYSMLQGATVNTEIIRWYEKHFYDTGAPLWYGLCYAWAAAASFESEPLYPSSVDNIIFRVGDKKGLLTFAHLQDFKDTQNCDDPAVLHYWLLHYIAELGRSFYADLDSGEEVWSYPIYKYNMQIIDVGQTSQVKVDLYYADDFVKPDFCGINELSKSYEYKLFKDSDGSITRGEWSGDSITSHPDSLTYVVAVNSNFAEFEFDYPFVKELAASQDDFLEKDDTVIIAPGSYNLILQNEDSYTLNIVKGESIRLDLSKTDDSNEVINFSLYDSDKHLVKTVVISQSGESVKIELEAVNPPYQCVLTQENYNSPNIYKLIFERYKSKFQFKLPDFRKNGEWTGVAITNSSDETARDICLVGYDAEGEPIATLWGPEKINGNTKKIFTISDLHCFMSDWLQIERLRVIGADTVAVAILSGRTNQAMTEVGKQFLPASHLVIPNTSSMSSLEYVRGGICSNSEKTQKIDLAVYNSEGRKVKHQTSVILAPGARLKLDSSFFYGYLPDNGWIDVQLSKEGNTSFAGLDGYLSSKLGLEAADMMRGLPVESTPLWLVHLPDSGFWKTTLVLINVNDEENVFHIEAQSGDEYREISVQPRQRVEVDLFDLFAGVEGEILDKLIYKVSAEASFCGYVNYQGNADYVFLPLISENSLSKVLTLPHIVVDAGWWTGICIFNPYQEDLAIRIVPVHIDGSKDEDEIRDLSMSAMSRQVLCLKTLWKSETIENISYLTIESADGTIGGFYLYGYLDNSGQIKLLAGSNM